MKYNVKLYLIQLILKLIKKNPKIDSKKKNFKEENYLVDDMLFSPNQILLQPVFYFHQNIKNYSLS